MTDGLFTVQVAGGTDSGAFLQVDGQVRTIGRSMDADLVLSDSAVSRRHLQVTVVGDHLRVVLCAGAAPFTIDGTARQSADVRSGARILIGSTLLLVTSQEVQRGAAARERPSTDLRTLLTGAGADVRGLSVVHALIELLDVAEDTAGVTRALLAWATTNVSATGINVERPGSAGVMRTAPSEITEVAIGADVTELGIPAPGDASVRIVFRCAIAAERVTDSLRRTLVVAARVSASAYTRVRRVEILDAERAALRASSVGSARAFLGTSVPAERLSRLVRRLSVSDVTVLLEGETGSGKSFVARLIHEGGARAKQPFRTINCAAIPEALVESELFGHERGAFTGAVAQRIGAIEAAGRGTLFLDEVAELPQTSQAKLLRVLEDRSFERIGSNRPVEMLARIICATNRNLEEMVTRGEFRSDLYFRIAVVRTSVPPLRERGDDIVLLARQILRDCGQSVARRVEGFTDEALKLIKRHSWPGNVRELRNAIEYALALGDGILIDAPDLPAGLLGPQPQPANEDVVHLPADLAAIEKRAIASALRAAGCNRSRAAAILGVNRTTLYKKMKEFGW